MAFIGRTAAVIEPRSAAHSGPVVNCMGFFILSTHLLGHGIFPPVSVVTPVLNKFQNG